MRVKYIPEIADLGNQPPPATPLAGHFKIYRRNGEMFYLDDEGSEHLVGDEASSGSNVTTIEQPLHGFTLRGTPVYKNISTGLWEPAICNPSNTDKYARAVISKIIDINSFQIISGGSITLTEAEWDGLTGDTGGLTPGTDYYTSYFNAGKYVTSKQNPSNLVLSAQSSTTAIINLKFTDTEEGETILHIEGTCGIDASVPLSPALTGITLADVDKLVMATESYSYNPGSGNIEFLNEYSIYRVIDAGGQVGITEIYKPSASNTHRLLMFETNIVTHNINSGYMHIWNGVEYSQYIPEEMALKNLSNISDSIFATKAEATGINTTGKTILHIKGTCGIDYTIPSAPVLTGITLADVGKLVMATESYMYDPGSGVIEFTNEYSIYKVINSGGQVGIVEIYRPQTSTEHRLLMFETNIVSHNIVSEYVYIWNGAIYTQYVSDKVALKDLTNVSDATFAAKAISAGVGGGGSSDIVISQTSHGFTVKGTPIAKDIDTGLWTAAVSYDGGGLAATAVVVGITDANTFTLSTGNYLLTLTTGEWDALTGGTGGLIPGQTYYTSNTVPGKYTTVVQDPINPVLLAQSATEAIIQIGFTSASVGEGERIMRHEFYALATPAAITLPSKAYSKSSITVFVGGVPQELNEYSLSSDGMELTITDYPPEGTFILILYPVVTLMGSGAEVGLGNVSNSDFKNKGISAGLITSKDVPIVLEMSTGTSSDHSVNVSSVLTDISEITAKTIFVIKASHRNDSSTHTLTITGIGFPTVYQIRRQGNLPLQTGDIKPGEWVMLKYDPDYGCMILMNPSTSPGYQMITKSGYNSILILINGRVYSTSGNTGTWSNHTSGKGPSANLITFGSTNFTEIPFPTDTNSHLPIIKIGGTYNTYAYALRSDGTLFGWGNNINRPLGIGDVTPVNYPTVIATDVIDVYDHPSKGEYSVDDNCLFIKKTDNKIYGSGYNVHGQLGLGDTTNRNTWTEITGLGTNTVKLIPLGTTRGATIALKSDGTIWICGNNSYGQLGLGNTTSSISSFTDVTMAWAGISSGVLDVKATGMFSYYTSAADYSGAIMMMITLPGGSKIVRTCGYNSSGILGVGDTAQRSSPVSVISSDNVIDIAMIGGGSLATGFMLKSDGTVWGWGNDLYGQVGAGTQGSYRSIPNPVSSFLNFVDKLFSDGMTCHSYGHYAVNFVRKDNRLFASGRGAEGQTGTGLTSNVATPTEVKLPQNEKVIDMGWFTTTSGGFVCVAVCESGNMYTWGHNAQNGVVYPYSSSSALVPIKIPKFWE